MIWAHSKWDRVPRVCAQMFARPTEAEGKREYTEKYQTVEENLGLLVKIKMSFPFPSVLS